MSSNDSIISRCIAIHLIGDVSYTYHVDIRINGAVYTCDELIDTIFDSEEDMTIVTRDTTPIHVSCGRVSLHCDNAHFAVYVSVMLHVLSRIALGVVCDARSIDELMHMHSHWLPMFDISCKHTRQRLAAMMHVIEHVHRRCATARDVICAVYGTAPLCSNMRQCLRNIAVSAADVSAHAKQLMLNTDKVYFTDKYLLDSI